MAHVRFYFESKSESKFNFIKIVMNLIDLGRSRLYNKVETKIDFHNVWLILARTPYGWCSII